VWPACAGIFGLQPRQSYDLGRAIRTVPKLWEIPAMAGKSHGDHCSGPWARFPLHPSPYLLTCPMLFGGPRDTYPLARHWGDTQTSRLLLSFLPPLQEKCVMLHQVLSLLQGCMQSHTLEQDALKLRKPCPRATSKWQVPFADGADGVGYQILKVIS
jgi:hypothetical protein